MTHWPLEMSMSFTVYTEATIKRSRQEIQTWLLTAAGRTSTSWDPLRQGVLGGLGLAVSVKA